MSCCLKKFQTTEPDAICDEWVRPEKTVGFKQEHCHSCGFYSVHSMEVIMAKMAMMQGEIARMFGTNNKLPSISDSKHNVNY